jgi:hypothetical protein
MDEKYKSDMFEEEEVEDDDCRTSEHSATFPSALEGMNITRKYLMREVCY